MTRSYLTRSWSMAALMLGATALSPPAVAQNANQVLAQNTNSTNSAANQSRQRPVDPGVRGGAPGRGGPTLRLNQNEANFFDAATEVFNEAMTGAQSLRPASHLHTSSRNHQPPPT